MKVRVHTKHVSPGWQVLDGQTFPVIEARQMLWHKAVCVDIRGYQLEPPLPSGFMWVQLLGKRDQLQDFLVGVYAETVEGDVDREFLEPERKRDAALLKEYLDEQERRLEDKINKPR
jgi:hypothetical protein